MLFTYADHSTGVVSSSIDCGCHPMAISTFNLLLSAWAYWQRQRPDCIRRKYTLTSISDKPPLKASNASLADSMAKNTDNESFVGLSRFLLQDAKKCGLGTKICVSELSFSVTATNMIAGGWGGETLSTVSTRDSHFNFIGNDYHFLMSHHVLVLC